MRTPAICLLLLLSFVLTARADTIPVNVVQVKDGDSIVVVAQGRETEVRLYGIDAPEWRQAYSRMATEALREMLTGRAVRIEPMDTDRYGRTVAVVYADGDNVDEAMIRNGLAWVYTKYCLAPFCADWKRYEEQARQSKLGLWRGPAPMPPWTFRSDQRRQTQQLAEMPTDAAGRYTGNVKSKRFHRAGCKDFYCKNCTRVFSDRNAALDAGFVPCGRCRP